MNHDQFLQVKGIRVSLDWLEQWQQQIESVDSAFSRKSVDAKQALLWQEVLNSDLHLIGTQTLPDDIQEWHKQQLQGLFVLQADEVINTAAAAKHRYEEATDKRCLKLMLTDGATQVTGLEYRHVKDLHVLMPAGVKIGVKDVTVRRGSLLLTPENTIVVGGQVDSLEKARQQALTRWNQPASGRTSRSEAGPVDLYAEASAAAWQDQGEAPAAQPSGPDPNTAPRPHPRQPTPVQPQHAPVLRAGQLAATLAAQPAVPARLGPTAPHQQVLRPPQSETPITPPDQLHQQPQLQPRGSHPHASISSSDAGNAAGQGRPSVATAARLQPARASGSSGGTTGSTETGHMSGVVPSHSGSAGAAPPQAAEQSQYHLQPASQHQLPRTNRLALTRTAMPPSQPPAPPHASPQQHAGTAGPPVPAHAAHAGPTPRHQQQPQQELIIIDDSPQLPRAQPGPQPGADHLHDMLDDADDNAVASQPARRHKRQLVESSSDSEQDTGQPNAAGRTAMDAEDETGPSDVGNDETDLGIENVDPAGVYSRYAGDIVPDSCADVGGVHEVYEDYGNEPMFEDDIDEPVDFYQDAEAYADDPSAAMDDTDQAEVMTEGLAAPASSSHCVDDYSDSGQQVPVSPDVLSDADVCTAKHRQAIEALFSPPHTSLDVMTKHLPYMLSSDFPMTLRINGKITQVLSKLAYCDADNQPLPEYAIDVELADATAKCVAIMGHTVLLAAIGLTTAEFTAEKLSGGKEQVTPYLQKMNKSLNRCFQGFILMDVHLKAPDAKLVIEELHEQWTEADKAALHMR